MSLLANSNAIESGGYNINRSLRFRSSASAYLSRTPASATNQNTWTWSGWVKRGDLGTSASKYLFSAYSSSSNFTWLRIGDDSLLRFYNYSGGVLTAERQSSAVLRDPSAWYHIICVYDSANTTAADRVKLYINGALASYSSTVNPTINQYSIISSANTHQIAAFNSSGFFDGYLAEVNFIDGQALTPSSFGQTDAVTGVWVPKKYTGTYGTNGFYLPFSDNTSATTLAYDKSGNGNNWTPNNISTTAGATYDSMTDVPTLTSATAANYCVLNPLSLTSPSTLSNGNLTADTGTTGGGGVWGTIAYPSSGKYYYEFVASGITSANCRVGVSDSIRTYSIEYNNDGTKTVNGAVTSYGASYTDGDVIGVACDIDGGTITFYKNNASQGSISNTVWLTIPQFAFCADGSGSAGITANFNFGQRPFSYTPPSGFKALNAYNLPDPTIKKPKDYFDVMVDTGSNIGLATIYRYPQLLAWIKDRTNVNNHQLLDSVRGLSGTDVLQSNTTSGTTSYATPTGNCVGWAWAKGATPGFDIVTYTGTGSAMTVAHSLGVKPAMYITKNRTSGTTNWFVYHQSLGNNGLCLNTTGAMFANSAYFSSFPNASNFYPSTDAIVNQISSSHVTYLFAEIAGFSKFGSYTGNGAAYPNGVFVYTGFRPRFLLIKMSGRAGTYWELRDTTRSPYNSSTVRLDANNSNAEESSNQIDIVSNGFVVTGSDAGINGSGDSYIYAAFAENPFKYSNAR